MDEPSFLVGLTMYLCLSWSIVLYLLCRVIPLYLYFLYGVVVVSLSI